MPLKALGSCVTSDITQARQIVAWSYPELGSCVTSDITQAGFATNLA